MDMMLFHYDHALFWYQYTHLCLKKTDIIDGDELLLVCKTKDGGDTEAIIEIAKQESINKIREIS